VAQGLPAAGGHEHDRVSAAHDLVDDGRLLTPELLIAEDIVEDIEGGGRGCGGHRSTLVHVADANLRVVQSCEAVLFQTDCPNVTTSRSTEGSGSVDSLRPRPAPALSTHPSARHPAPAPDGQ